MSMDPRVPDYDPTSGVPDATPRPPTDTDQDFWDLLGRLQEQEQILAPLAVSFAEHLDARSRDQESVLRQVYRPMTQYADAQVAQQAVLLRDATLPILYPIHERLTMQAAGLAQTPSGQTYLTTTDGSSYQPQMMPPSVPRVDPDRLAPRTPSSLLGGIPFAPSSEGSPGSSSPTPGGAGDMSGPSSPGGGTGSMPYSSSGGSPTSGTRPDDQVIVCRPVPLREICPPHHRSVPPASPPPSDGGASDVSGTTYTTPMAPAGPMPPAGGVGAGGDFGEDESDTVEPSDEDEAEGPPVSPGAATSEDESSDDYEIETEEPSTEPETPGVATPTEPPLPPPEILARPVTYIPYPAPRVPSTIGWSICQSLDRLAQTCSRELDVSQGEFALGAGRTLLTGLQSDGITGWITSAIDTVSRIGENIIDAATDAGKRIVSALAERVGLDSTSSLILTEIAWDAYQSVYSDRLSCPQTTRGITRTIGLLEKLEREGAGPFTYLAQDLTYTLHYLHPRLIPSQEMVDRSFLTGSITSEEWACLTRMNGYVPYWREKVVLAQQSLLTPEQATVAYYRGLIDSESYREIIRSHGYLRPDVADAFIELAKFIPTPSDAISFLVKDVFLPDTPGMDEAVKEFREQIGAEELFHANSITSVDIPIIKGSALASALGRGAKLPPNISRSSEDKVRINVPLTYWLAHYRECSPTQVYEMLHRLRPGRVVRYQLRNPDGTMRTPQPVTMKEVEYLLKKDDYHPIWRDRLAAISYRPIGRIDARRMYESGVLGVPQGVKGVRLNPDGTWAGGGPAEQELYEIYQDMGYSPADAARLTLYTARTFDETKANKKKRLISRETCEMYSLGVISRDEAINELVRRGLTDQEATQYVSQCDLRHRITQVREQLRVIRQRVIDGRDTLIKALDRLKQIGIKGPRAADYIAKWELEREKKPREETARDILGWYRDALIDRGQAVERLVAIGYSESNARLMLAAEDAGIRARTLREAERRERERQRAEERLRRARERQIAAARREGEEAMRRMLSARSLRHLAQWLEDGTITPDEVRTTLRMKGWNDGDIERWLVGTARRIMEREERRRERASE